MHKSDNRQARPNIFIVGDCKSGTTSLYRLLQLTRDVGTSRTRKELHFFSAPELLRSVSGPGDNAIVRAIVRDRASYLAEFAHVPRTAQQVIDVSPSYLRCPKAAERIKAFAPDARIVIVLRDPASKVFSQYSHLWSESRETLPFEVAFARSADRRASGYSGMFDYEAGGRYADVVKHYIDVFGRHRVHIQIFEQLFDGSADACSTLQRFLQVTLPDGSLPHLNRNGVVASPIYGALLKSAPLRRAARGMIPLPLYTALVGRLKNGLRVRRPRLQPDTRAWLNRYYAADTQKLETLIARNTGWPVAALPSGGSPQRAFEVWPTSEIAKSARASPAALAL